MFSNKPNELLLIYNPTTSYSKQCLACAKSITKHIKEWNITKDQLSETQCLELIQSLKENATYLLERLGIDSESDDKHIILRKHQHLIDKAVVLYQNKIMYVKTPSDIMQLASD